MTDPIEVCMKIWRDLSSKNDSDDDTNEHKKLSFKEYLINFQKLTIIDILLGILLIGILAGFALSFSDSLKPYSMPILRTSFLGIVSFLTLKMTHQKFAADMCLSCQGVNVMSFTTKVNVLLSFCWTIIQTFIALVLNVTYYFLILFMLYILFRSHLLYDFGRLSPYKPLGDEEEVISDMRFFSLLHKKMQSNSIGELARGGFLVFLVRLIYWPIMVIAITSIIAYTIMIIATPSVVQKLRKKKLSGILALFVPFLATGCTLLLRFTYGRLNFSWIDMVIARHITPALNFSTLTSGFDFLSGDILKSHATVFGVALVCAVVYSMTFLHPLSKSDMCTNGEISNNEKLDEFKNRFLLGHYLIGLLVAIAYIIVFGGNVGKRIIVGACALALVVYVLPLFVSATNLEDDEESLVKK